MNINSKAMKTIILTLSITLLNIWCAVAQVTDLDRVGQTPGGSGYHVNWLEASNRLIVGCGTSLWVYDMTNPANPLLIGKRPFLGLITETILDNNNNDVLFVAASFDGVYAIDLSSDSLEVLDHEYMDNQFVKRAAYDMTLVGDTLLIPLNGKIARLKYIHGSGFTTLTETGQLFATLFCIDSKNNFVVAGQQGIFNGKILLYNQSDINTPIASWQHNTIKSVSKVSTLILKFVHFLAEYLFFATKTQKHKIPLIYIIKRLIP